MKPTQANDHKETMNLTDYIEASKRTDLTKEQYENDVVERMVGKAEIIHAAIGICTEAGELLDAIKKTIIYGKELDVTNVVEELGDILWYFAIAARWAEERGISVEQIMQANIDKLAVRFPEKFEGYQALVRDLDAERKVLESKVKP